MNAQSHRLAEGGRIRRERPLAFTFDGRPYEGYEGDTLASALLANGVTLVGRSFKYHRPRGILAAGVEEPNALVQLGAGPRTLPNVAATEVALSDGLAAESVNRWPNLDADLMMVNDWLARLMPAAFYYKTFMWPRRLWLTYEAAIRHAAGLGRAPRAPDPDRYDKMHLHCDVLVAGGGPAGLAAALAAGRAGARVVVADQDSEFGGAVLGERAEIDGAPATEWVAAAVDELAAGPEVRLLPRTTVFGYYDHNFLGLVERVADGAAIAPGAPRQRLWKVRAKQVVLATGAIERPLVFADNDRPGIMLAGAVRAYVNRFAVVPGRRAVVFTNNDDAYRTALDLKAAGVEVACVVDLRHDPDGELPDRAVAEGIDVLPGWAVVAVHGSKRVSAVEVMELAPSGAAVSGEARRVDCDLVCMSGGWNPAIHLFSQSGGRARFEDARAIFVPGDSVQAERSAGAASGTFGLAGCLAEGDAAGAKAAAAAGRRKGARGRKAPSATEVEEGPWRHLWVVPGKVPAGRGGKHFVDLHNDVTAADIALAAREGYESVEHAKRYTTLGMGTDQGKTGNVAGLAILARERGADIPTVGTTTFRPPYTPVTFGALAGRDIGGLADPVRRTPLHPWHQARGAVFEDVGQWKRPRYYPRPGESMHDAVNRECRAARTGIAILDASTLGKIDVRGRDAATLLNRVYTNDWDTLGVGRCRYGLMLGDDGMVLDDGVTARLGEHHYLMTTTTGNAARVLGWLEEWLQTEWPELEVYLTSVTEHWATVTLCGPGARGLLAGFCDGIDLDAKAFPFMAVRQGRVAGIPARVFRVSFTGEPSFEVNVPAGHAMALWTALTTAGQDAGLTPFGTEAMHVLRAEKGYIMVGQETDGTVTPVDLGMDWILSTKKDFIGRRSLARADAVRADRKQLVGLLTEDPKTVLPEGGQIVAERRERPPVPMIGHVTSSYFSATLGHSIALALVKGGRSRHGDTVHVPLADRTVAATVSDPAFFDPQGSRLRA